MTFTLHTYDIQDIVLALICNDSSVLKSKPDAVDHLKDLFADINRMCNASNDYTVTFTVE